MVVIYGGYFYTITSNLIILLSTIFIPLGYETFIQFYRNWQENDFLILGDVEQYNKKYKKALELE